MTSVKVVDLNEEVAKGSLNSNTVRDEDKEEPPIEEAPEEVEKPEIINEVVEETNEEAKEEPKEIPEATPKVKPKAKPKPSDIVQCPDCSRSMTYKNLRYSHKCYPEPPPVKKQANPKGKAKPKPVKPHEVVSKPRATTRSLLFRQRRRRQRKQTFIKAR